MLLNKHNLKIWKFVSKDKPYMPKREIVGVLVLRDKVVATDSVILVEMDLPKIDVKEYPTTPDITLKNYDNVIVPAEFFKKIKISKHKNFPILENIATFDAGKKQFGLVQNNNIDVLDDTPVNIAITHLIEGEFPDYKRAMPDKDPLFEFNINAEYLERACNVLKEFNDLGSIRISFYDNDNPIKLETETKEGQGVKVMIMPLKE